MFTWVHYEDLGTKQGKNACIWVSIMSFSIFLPTLVNHTQDLMCLKCKANLNYKLHPNVHIDTVYWGVKIFSVYFKTERLLTPIF